MTDAKAVAIWLRVSTEDQVKGESPEVHEARARAYASSRGWDVATVYRLDAVSGKSVREHPECERMLRDVAAGTITALIFSKLARLARNTRELLEFADYFAKHEADLVSLQESIDTSTPAGRLFYTMIAALAQWEREEIASRVAASVPTRARMGRSVGGAAPYGYRWENQKLALDPTEAPIRKLIYELFLETRRKKTVARTLNERGYRTRRGKRWMDSSISWLIEDPTAKGKRRANYTTQNGEPKGWELKPEQEWVWFDVPPIVSEELWDQCNAILLERKQGRPRPAKRVRHLFVGLAFCACGGRMQVPSNNPKYICPKCKNKIPLADLEAIFHEQLRSFVLSPEEIGRHFEQADEVIREKEALVASAEAKERGLSQDMDRIMALYLEKRLTPATFSERHQPLEQQRAELRSQIPQLMAELDFLRISRASSDEIIREAQDLYGRWGSLTPDEKRRIAEQLTERIVVGKGEVDIHLLFQPSRAELVAGRQRTLSGCGRR